MFDEALSRSVGPDGASGLGAAAWKPPMDLFEEPERYVLRADLPGIAPTDVELQVEDGTLRLRGERRFDSAVSRESYLRIERPHGRFSVQVSLPPSVDDSAIRASHRNGVIEVVLPKRKESVPSRVRITEG
jgi:HSP20 family protein